MNGWGSHRVGLVSFGVFLCVVLVFSFLRPGDAARIRERQFGINTCENAGCHAGIEQIHPLWALKCVDCHGGNDKQAVKELAHVSRPASFGEFPLVASTHRNNDKELRGPRAYREEDTTNSDHRAPTILAYRRFLNPGDFLVADNSCGNGAGAPCHGQIVERTLRSLHATMAGLMSGMYFANGAPGVQEVFEGNATDKRDVDKRAKVAILFPRGEPITDPNFDPTIEGTLPSVNVEVPRDNQDARLARFSDPIRNITFYIQTDCARCHLYADGGKDPGDYRSQGCSGCHVLYASDGLSRSVDVTIPKDETDHPFKHEMQRFTADEQCGHCHNRGARHTQEFIGMRERPQGFRDFLLNDHLENNRREDPVSGGRRLGFYPDAPLFFKPGDPLFPDPEQPNRLKPYEPLKDIPGLGVLGVAKNSIWRRGISPGGNPFFVTDENRDNSFDETPPDIHLERGMGCVDCHTREEMHGDGHIYTDRFFKNEIECESCHGTPLQVTTLKTRKGRPVEGLIDNSDGTFSIKLKTSGKILPVPQIKRIIDSGRNPNTIDGCLLHAGQNRLECFACHSTWNNQCMSCHMIQSVDPDEGTGGNGGGFFRRSHMDNIERIGTQGQPRFTTTFDQLYLGINNQGRIQNFHISGQAVLFAVQKTLGENNPDKGNFFKFGFCQGGERSGQACETADDCPGGSCPSLMCTAGANTGQVCESDSECNVCIGGGRAGQPCSLNGDCAFGRCQGGDQDGKLCTANSACPGGQCSLPPAGSPERAQIVCSSSKPESGGLGTCGTPSCTGENVGTCGMPDTSGKRTCQGGGNKNGALCNSPYDCLDENACGVRFDNLLLTTFDNGLHLPAMPFNPIFPHTTRKIPRNRNCDTCHAKPGQNPLEIARVRDAIGLGDGKVPVVVGTNPDGTLITRDIRVDRKVRVFTGNKRRGNEKLTELSIINPATGQPFKDFEEMTINLDQFIDVELKGDEVVNLKQLRPTTHVGTGPLDKRAIEKMIRNRVNPQVFTQPGP